MRHPSKRRVKFDEKLPGNQTLSDAIREIQSGSQRKVGITEISQKLSQFTLDQIEKALRKPLNAGLKTMVYDLN